MFIGFKMSRNQPMSSGPQNASASLDQLIELIDQQYADSIDIQQLYHNGIEGILSQLDPHTVYIPAKDLVRTNEELEGRFYGIGIEFFVYEDTVLVTSILPEGPSSKSGLYPGDRLIQVDDSLIAGKQREEEDIINLIRGTQQSPVKLLVMHPDGKLATITVKRDIIPLKSVRHVMMPQTGTGYIAIRMFSETTAEEFRTALKNLQQKGIQRLIIDVRDNPGGYMNAVAEIVDELVAGEHIVVQTKGKRSSETLRTGKAGLFEQGPVAVLINENSASASEILAGALQDLDRGTIIGRRSYGKGLVQEQFELPDYSAIRITVARYYLASGRCIQKSFAEGKEAYHHDLVNRFQHGELTNSDSVAKPRDTIKTYRTLKNRIVYGEEGIRPDYFVGEDTMRLKQLNVLYSKRLVERCAAFWYYLNKNKVPAFNDLVDLQLWVQQQAPAFEEFSSTRLSFIIPDRLKNLFIQEMQVELSDLVFDENKSAQVRSQHDAMIQKALTVLK